jgi:signal peptidase II
MMQHVKQGVKQRGAFLYGLLGLTAALTIALDQWSKAVIRGHFKVCPSPAESYIPLAGRYFGLIYACNTGSAFSFFEHGQQGLLFFLIALALAVVVWLYIRYARGAGVLLQISFGLVLGGAAGNLIDRFHLGFVTDFLLFRIPPVFSWPVFNLADSSICVGIGFLVFSFWRWPTAGRQPSPTGHPQDGVAELPEPSSGADASRDGAQASAPANPSSSQA